ncbi:unnamed protein product [Didymodactylos carnosus]|uniref:BZIP domain-containing protein n=1 Tax=Didymodactylos carnosus TaxID=1234261 RepID=A0A8S2GYC8_9BILA|nr:unnamed protein product [Didymodactylos carnosus]CAF3571914.1 unnamed protein product [Didymodactylos carnosus]
MSSRFQKVSRTCSSVMRDIESFESTKPVSLAELCQLRDSFLPTSPPVSSSVPPKKKFIIRNHTLTSDNFLTDNINNNNDNNNNNNSSFIQIIIDQKPYTLQVETQETNFDKMDDSYDMKQVMEQEIKSQDSSATTNVTQNMSNEVTSSNRIPRVKRPRLNQSLVSTNLPSVSNNNGTGDVGRRKHIRDSNREAARRCRERRRQYIETLENNLEREKEKTQKLEVDLQNLKRENTQLKTILSETTKLSFTTTIQ